MDRALDRWEGGLWLDRLVLGTRSVARSATGGGLGLEAVKMLRTLAWMVCMCSACQSPSASLHARAGVGKRWFHKLMTLK